MAVKKKLMMPDAESECVSIGIVSPLKDYRLCWFLNNCLDIDLQKVNDLDITDPQKRKQLLFTRFKYEEPVTRSEFYVLQNKINAAYLLPEIKQADFILLIKGSYYQQHQKEIINKIKTVQEIQITVPFDMATLKSKKNILLYDDEKRK
ncbi:MAG: IPExxxVDY family protein [Fimbriimonadaceae bacterium]|nr:IPExxxVDY family protein [Chitinophagales bacterium]